MEIHKLYCDMCKREIHIDREQKHLLEISKADYSLLPKRSKFDLCTECVDVLLDLLKEGGENGDK